MPSEADHADLDTADQPLRFDVPDDPSESYRRPRRNGIVVRPIGRYRFAVSITDDPVDERQQHVAEMYRETVADGPDFRGRCSCKGWQFHAGPCAHLWGLKFAVEHGTVEIARLKDAFDGGAECPTCGAYPPGEKP